MKIRPARLSRAKVVAGVSLVTTGVVAAAFAALGGAGSTGVSAAAANPTTPIKHVVVLFPENISFDHYFGTYPYALNTPNDGPSFTAKAGTKVPNNYLKTTATGLTAGDFNTALASSTGLTAGPANTGSTNPNSTDPFRLSPEQAWTCSQNHSYTPEQKAVLGTGTAAAPGMDQFPEQTNAGSTCQVNIPATLPATGTTKDSAEYYAPGENMGYYDGNTVTAVWNYAQNYAMSDNAWDDNFGPSTVGALNLVSGQTYGAISYDAASDDEHPTAVSPTGTQAFGVSAVDPTTGVGTVISDPDPVYDDCANLDHTKAAASNPLAGMQSSNKNIGDLLGDVTNDQGVTWGWFQGGFNPTTKWDGTTGHYAKCDATSYSAYTQAQISNGAVNATYDYNPHHNPFAYYKSTSNPHHFPMSPNSTIGGYDPTNDQTKTGANHQYDLSVFDDAAQKGQLPAVSFVKPKYAEDGHPNNSDPIDEQHFLVKTINELEKGPEWSSTAIIINYDDSDGWYDHQAPTITNGATNATDNTVLCTAVAARVTANEVQDDRCGPSQRLPFMVISPYAKSNFIDQTDKLGQASIIKFVEANWGLGSIGDGSFDKTDGAINAMFDFNAAPQANRILLNADGTIAANEPTAVPTVTVTQPGATVTQPGTPGATVTVPPSHGRSSVACVRAQDSVKLYKAKHKVKMVKRAKKKVATACK